VVALVEREYHQGRHPQDIDWMSRSGLGGLQNFDAEMMTPQLVAKRLPYMSPDWADAFRFAARLARGKAAGIRHRRVPGLERDRRSVGAAAGRHEEAGMERDRRRRRPARYAEAGAAAAHDGPFQDLFVQPDIMGQRPDPAKLARFGGDIAVYAIPVAAAPCAAGGARGRQGPRRGQAGDAGRSRCRRAARRRRRPPTVITFDYPAPQTLRSATIFFPGAATLFDGAGFQPVLEASDDGTSGARSPTCRCRWRPPRRLRAGDGGPLPGRRHGEAGGRQSRLHAGAGADMGPFASIGKTKGLRLSQLTLSAEPKVNQFESKAGFATVDDYYALDAGVDPGEAGVQPSTIIDLSGKVRRRHAGWTPPKGRWKIVRIGYSLTGTENHPATPEATGLEVDKYDGAAVRATWTPICATTKTPSARTWSARAACARSSPTASRSARPTGPRACSSSSSACAATTRGPGCRRWPASWSATAPAPTPSCTTTAARWPT
jgi:hypothetical protein